MSRLVMKFGGTSVADLERIRRVARLVAAEVATGKKVAVVVSAMSGKTNELVAWTDGAGRAAPGLPESDDEYDAIVASEKNIKTAAAHAAEQGLEIGYRPATAEQLLAEGAGPFDVVLTMEVIEHVADPGEFLRTCSRLLAPGGLLIVATLNRTLKALALAKIGAEYVLRWVPPGTHDWKQFLKPEELRAFLAGEAVDVQGPFGVAYNPLTGRWSRSSDSDINYMMTVTKA